MNAMTTFERSASAGTLFIMILPLVEPVVGVSRYPDAMGVLRSELFMTIGEYAFAFSGAVVVERIYGSNKCGIDGYALAVVAGKIQHGSINQSAMPIHIFVPVVPAHAFGPGRLCGAP